MSAIEKNHENGIGEMERQIKALKDSHSKEKKEIKQQKER